jgi:hypothetical protein
MRPMPPLPASTAVASLLACAIGLSALTAPTPPRLPAELTVAAGTHHRRQTLVNLPIVGLSPATPYSLRDAAGRELPVQVDTDGRAWLLLPSLDAGQQRAYTLVEGRSEHGGSAMRATRTGDDIAVMAAGRPVLTYLGGPGRLPSADVKPAYQRGGYIHPVRTPSGRIVTDDYPDDHRHQHGVMMAWTSAEFEGRKTDFWNMGNSLGRVEAVAIDAVDSGPVLAHWTARHHYVDLTSGAPRPAINEAWHVRVYAVERAHVFEIDVQHTAATSVPLLLPEYHYGGMAVRGAAAFRGDPANAIVLTSEGKDRATADNTRARWVHISGRVDDGVAGIAILGHPANFRSPEPLRVHPTDPYVCFAPSRLGAWAISPGTARTFRYRLVASDGPADPATLDRLWHDFAEPPTVTVK